MSHRRGPEVTHRSRGGSRLDTKTEICLSDGSNLVDSSFFPQESTPETIPTVLIRKKIKTKIKNDYW